MPDDKIKNLPEPPSDTIGNMETVRIDLDGLYHEIQREADEPLNLRNLGLADRKDILSTLSRKPPQKYHFRKSIGHGGMKVVMQVKDCDTTRDIAMALLPDAASRPMQDILRFVEEARITASLEHPNIVPVHDIGIDAAGAPYFTMKLLKGETLAAVLKKLEAKNPEYLEKYTLDKLLRVFLKICNAIAFAHSKGVLHLDLKPENVQLGDFGEVIVMDWGLARVVSEEKFAGGDQELTETRKDALKVAEGETLDGVRKGTPGYMAPEQAAGRNSEKDFQTDIYALGAILYSMATYLNPLPAGKELKDMLIDTVHGNIIPPKERAPERIIPTALEAVIMKAMSRKPEDRYQNVRDLRNEVVSFLNGYATVAEKATTAKKILLFYRRHKISVLAVSLALLLGLTAMGYAMIEVSRQRGDWIPADQRDFTRPEATLSGLHVRNSTMALPMPLWKLDADGLKMNKMEWLCLPDLGIKGNVRVVLELAVPLSPETLELCINSKQEKLPEPWSLPSGYSFQIASYGGAMDSISRNDRPGNSELFAAEDSKLLKGDINELVFQRIDGKLSIQVNNKKLLTAEDLFPLTGKGFDRIFLRTQSNGMKIRKLSVYRLALPKKASPVVAGDALVENRHYEDAIEKYLTLADDYKKDPIAEEALAKAYMTAASQIKDPKRRSTLLMAIKSRIASRSPSFRYRETLSELDVLMLWKSGNYKDAQIIIDDLFTSNPRTGIIKKILLLPHTPLPQEVQESFLRHIVRSRNMNRLNLSNMGLYSLNALTGMRLAYLDCSGNQLTSLSGIESMPLEVLLCYNNQLKDLKPLTGNTTLKTLSAEQNRISDLTPLKGVLITDLNISENRISQIQPLEKLPLERLLARDNRISDLTPLKGIPLKRLDLGRNPISSIAPLKNLALEILKLDDTNISDLTPLKGMPLTVLGLYRCTNLNRLEPLMDIPTLEVLSIPAKSKNTLGLTKLPNLQYLSDSSPLPFSIEDTVENFVRRKLHQK